MSRLMPSGPRDGLVGLAGPAAPLLSVLDVDASSSPVPPRSPSRGEGRRFIPPAVERRARTTGGLGCSERFEMRPDKGSQTWCGFEMSLTGVVWRALRFGAGMGMTTVWRPRVRIEVRDVVVEVESKAEVTEEELLTKKGTKRKIAPRTKGPCEHGVKYRSKCKVCSKCEHGRTRYACKECGGSQICEHGRERCRCKECGGSQICEHGRIRSKCKECRAAKAGR